MFAIGLDLAEYPPAPASEPFGQASQETRERVRNLQTREYADVLGRMRSEPNIRISEPYGRTEGGACTVGAAAANRSARAPFRGG